MDNRFVSPFAMWGMVFLGAFFVLSIAPRDRLFDLGSAGIAFLVIFILVWVNFFSLGLLANRQAARSASGITRIIQTGVYGIVRHPIYFADMLLALGVFLAFPEIRILFSALWLVAVLYFWAGLEEKALLEKFGKEYEEYQKKAPKLFPRLFR